MMHALGDLFKPEEKEITMERDHCSSGCCVIWTWKVFVRIICLLAGILQTAMGGWVFYTIGSTKTKTVENYLQLSVIGFYCCLTGLMIVFAESRTRWTRRAVKVFVFFCNGLARGLIYILVGAVDQAPLNVEVFGVENVHRYVGLVCIAGGLVSIGEFLMTFRRNRARLNKAIARHQEETKGTQLYDLFERDDPVRMDNPSIMEKEKDPNYIHQDLEMQQVQEA
ncbi:hypothetical protein DICPUDRAFT_93359 [Dictyostelium purpureum]|uniref:Transmembrane protein n=1 Tax=Dictyostelium purpureum TaxID=5786 RepID=F1A6F4_DICPU|nr:uncharacterized protein DICPUDRAFT_93359 [Dictyostelium purpureum]EGC28226.1 hypothetical protein DICPUDRAFT_93359 [Dictyostelium purpureum]|eukprot:XP_003295248.1 hypothetical protein DICPUDRAFT_93359 [Dictyostelium purpureum]